MEGTDEVWSAQKRDSGQLTLIRKSHWHRHWKYCCTADIAPSPVSWSKDYGKNRATSTRLSIYSKYLGRRTGFNIRIFKHVNFNYSRRNYIDMLIIQVRELRVIGTAVTTRNRLHWITKDYTILHWLRRTIFDCRNIRYCF